MPPTQYLFKVDNGWLADHRLIDESSELTTTDPYQALRFVDHNAAATRAQMILHLFPGLSIEEVKIPSFLET